MDDGIIFGQRGQGLLTSGRGSIFGQRGALDPIVQAYDDILATDPTVPVLLQLREYRGRQILFQDPACTIPVTDPGDPIGGVRHPITGEIIAVQETDANRPVWGGVSAGIYIPPNDEAHLAWFPDQVGRTDWHLMTVSKTDGSTSGGRADIAAHYSGGASHSFWLRDEGEQLRGQLQLESSRRNLNAGAVEQPPEPMFSRMSWDGDIYTVEKDGQISTTDSYSGPIGDSTNDGDEPAIGNLNSGSPSSGADTGTYIHAVVTFNRDLTEEIEDVRDAMISIREAAQ